MECVDQYVRVLLTNGCEVLGECFTVDPISKSVVVLTQDSRECTNYFPKVILTHAIRSIEIEEMPSSFSTSHYEQFKDKFSNFVFGNKTDQSDCIQPEEISCRQKKLQDWLELNRLPVSIANDNILSVVNGLALIEPPYTVESCRSTNTIVLDRVMRIVKSCPDLEN